MGIFDTIRNNVTTRQVAEYYGLKVNRNGMACCPFHNDRHPSMKLDRRFHCFGCQADGDAVDYVGRLYGLGAKEAAYKIADDFHIPVEQEKINIHSVFCRYSPITYIYSFLIYKDNKVGFCEITYYYSNDYSTYHNEYIYIVKPLFEECVLLQNPNSVLDGFQMYYAAVRKDHKWGILDQKPRQITYKAINLNLADESEANYDELIFKYDSLNELKEDADNELKKRYH